MPIAGTRQPAPSQRRDIQVGDDDGATRETTLPVDVVTNARDPFELFAALIIGGVRLPQLHTERRRPGSDLAGPTERFVGLPRHRRQRQASPDQRRYDPLW